MSNGYGSYRTTAADDQAAHDRCPSVLRKALNYAVADWASEVVLRRYHEHTAQLGPAEACRRIILAMVKSDRANTARTYGPTHPEARV